MDNTPQQSDSEIAAVRIGPPDVLNAPIRLVEYDPAWPRLYDREAARIRAALTDQVLLIEQHIASGLKGWHVARLVARIGDDEDEGLVKLER